MQSNVLTAQEVISSDAIYKSATAEYIVMFSRFSSLVFADSKESAVKVAKYNATIEYGEVKAVYKLPPELDYEDIYD